MTVKGIIWYPTEQYKDDAVHQLQQIIKNYKQFFHINLYKTINNESTILAELDNHDVWEIVKVNPAQCAKRGNIFYIHRAISLTEEAEIILPALRPYPFKGIARYGEVTPNEV